MGCKRKRDRPAVGAGMRVGRGRSAAAALPADRMLELIESIVRDALGDERKLRRLVRARIEAGQSQAALALLTDWDERAAGDVLLRQASQGHENSG